MKCGTKAKKYASGGETTQRDKAIMKTEGARREESRQRKMVADARREEKEMRANEEGYNRSLTSPEMVNPPQTKKAMGGKVSGYAKGGSIDGCAIRGKTKAARGKG